MRLRINQVKPRSAYSSTGMLVSKSSQKDSNGKESCGRAAQALIVAIVLLVLISVNQYFKSGRTQSSFKGFDLSKWEEKQRELDNATQLVGDRKYTEAAVLYSSIFELPGSNREALKRKLETTGVSLNGSRRGAAMLDEYLQLSGAVNASDLSRVQGVLSITRMLFAYYSDLQFWDDCKRIVQRAQYLLQSVQLRPIRAQLNLLLAVALGACGESTDAYQLFDQIKSGDLDDTKSPDLVRVTWAHFLFLKGSYRATLEVMEPVMMRINAHVDEHSQMLAGTSGDSIIGSPLLLHSLYELRTASHMALGSYEAALDDIARWRVYDPQSSMKESQQLLLKNIMLATQRGAPALSLKAKQLGIPLLKIRSACSP